MYSDGVKLGRAVGEGVTPHLWQFLKILKFLFFLKKSSKLLFFTFLKKLLFFYFLIISMFFKNIFKIIYDLYFVQSLLCGRFLFPTTALPVVLSSAYNLSDFCLLHCQFDNCKFLMSDG